VLDTVGSRVRISYLKKFLANPQAVKPGTTMPNLLAGDPDRDARVEALVHFLASTGSLPHERPMLKRFGAGRDLYHKVGCVACHGTRTAAGAADKVLPTSVPLGDLKAKYSLASLAAFLERPHLVRPSGRMPVLLAGQEARDVANYLIQGIKVDLAGGKGAPNYAYYQGHWDKLPDFARLKPVARGIAAGFDLGVAARNDNFALKFDGVFKVDREAEYTFTLTSDDGSQLLIDGKLVVNNDGIHPPTTKQGKAKLSRGIHKVTVTFFQAGGGVELKVGIDAPGFGYRELGELVANSEAALEKKPAPKKTDEDALDIQPVLVAKGKVLFGSLGCASCHQLTADKKPIVSALKAPLLSKLKPKNGCLSPTPAKGLPSYGLSAAQRKALTAALETFPPAQTPATRIADTMTAFNCYACHSRAKVGGPEEEFNKSFQTTQPEMGDEGRVPPPLDGVGAKLNPDYFLQLLDKGGHDRPYMHTRMPGFGSANVGHVVKAFAALDKLPVIPAVKFTETLPRIKAKARHLVGGQALGCIKCHTFNNVRAEGVQGIDMTRMPKRLRRDWFHAYIGDPGGVRPGTRMPNSFIDGKSVLPEILDGKAITQIEAMWVYLQDGPKARLPLGIGRHSIVLEPTTTAILYRNFIKGAGTRAIAVGYPEKAHLAFDANELRLALLWKGDFIDAARHWTDRGSGFGEPLGEDILSLPAGPAFAILAKRADTWPTVPARALGLRFRGYRLNSEDRPTFLYSFGDVKIEDFPNPVAGKDTVLRRTLTFTAPKPVANLHYRTAAGNKIESLANGWYQVDGVWKVKVIKGSKPVLRKAGGKSELLVPIPLADGKAEVVQEYRW
jgi:mono/diheme cytochrome c family protein